MKNFRKITALLLTVLMVVTMLPLSAITAWATTNSDIWDGSIATGFASGSGTEQEPYIIKTAPQLAYFAQSVNNGTSYQGKYIKLESDIALNNTSNWTSWRYSPPSNIWTPIGKSTQYAFKGTFDGNNFIVSGIWINKFNDYNGLFGCVNGGTIENVEVVESLIYSYMCSGGIAAENELGTIKNCHNSSTLMSFADSSRSSVTIGGIIGSNTGIIENCCNTGEITAVSGEPSSAYAYIGGITGSNSGTIKNCYNVAAITGTTESASSSPSNSASGYTYVGGVVGRNTNGTIETSYNRGFIKGIAKKYSNNNYSDYNTAYVGGIVGYNSAGTVTKCRNLNNISGTATSFTYAIINAGGIIGYNTGTIKYNYNTGDVTGTATGSQRMISLGGVIGRTATGSTVSDCYNTGDITGNSSRIGGIVGEHNGSLTTCYNVGYISGVDQNASGVVGVIFGTSGTTVKNCYYLDESVSASSNTYGTALSIEKLALKDNFVGFNFNTVWDMGNVEEHPYPILKDNQHVVTCESYGHIGGIATCIEEAICVRCGMEYGEYDLNNHAYGTAFCNKKAFCSNCKIEYGEFDSSNHDGETIVKSYLEPTCIKEGYTGDVYCSACDGLLQEGEIIAATGAHDIVDGYCTKCDYCDILEQGICGENLTWKIYKSNGILEVLGTGDMYSYSQCTAPWYQNRNSIQSVSLPDGITSIGSAAFYDCNNITSLSIPDSVIIVEKESVMSCDNLQSITIGSGVEDIQEHSFAHNRQLSIINYNAENCNDFTQDDFSFTQAGYDSEGVTVIIGNTVQRIPANIFYRYVAVSELVFQENSKCSVIGAYAFCGMKLKSITVPESITKIEENAFADCQHVTTVNYNAVSCEDFTEQSKVFYTLGCQTDGVTVFIGAKVERIPAYIFYSSYDGDISDICFAENSKCNEIGNFSFYFNNLSNITLPENIVTIGEYAFGINKNLVSVNLPNSLKTIERGAFNYCPNLLKITVPKNTTFIGDQAFLSCSKLKTVYNHSELDIVKGATTHGYVAYYADNVYAAPCENDEHSGGVAGCDMLAICELCGMEYGNYLHINTEIRDNYEPNCTSDGYSGNIYCVDCGDLLEYGESIPVLGHNMLEEECTRCGYLTALAKGNCGTNVKWLLYPDGRLVIYGSGDMTQYANYSSVPYYEYRDQITSITVENLVTSISPYAFYGLSNAQALSLSDSITEIPNYAFYGCNQLTRVDIGTNIESIGTNAFSNCNNLTSVYFKGKAPTSVGTTPFGDTATKPIYYYTTASGWSTAVVNDKWNGYQAIPRNAITEDIPSTQNAYVIKVVDKYNTPVVNATVNLGGTTKQTDANGMTYFTKPTTAKSLTVSKTGFTTFTNTSFKSTTIGFIDYIELSDTPSTLRGISCNGESISSNILTVNCIDSGSLSITVSGSCPRGIVGYTLLQDNRVLQTVRTTATTYTFTVNHSSLEEDGKIIVQMQTSEGDVIAKQLNIDIIKMPTQVDSSFLDVLDNLKITLPVVGELPIHLNGKMDNGISVKQNGRSLFIGVNVDADKFASATGKSEKKSLMQKLKKQCLQKLKGDAGFNFEYLGYVELLYVGNGEYQVVSSDMQFVFSGELSAKAGASFYGIVGANIKVSLKSEAQLALSITGFELQKFVMDEVDLTVETELKVAGTVYILWGAGSASLYGKGALGFTLEIYPEFGFEKVYVNAEAGVSWSVLWGWFKGSHVFWQGSLYNYDRDAYLTQTAYASMLRRAMRDPNYNSINDRAYLEYRSEWLYGASGFNLLEAYSNLQTSVYDEIAPKLITLNGTTVMVWLDDNAARDENNFQTLYYSVYNKNTGIWSEPMQVDTNNTFDCEFDLFSDGTNIYVIYTEQTSELSGISEIDISNVEDVEKLLTGVEVKVCKFNGSGFDAPVSLTDNTVCETLPTIISQNGTITAVWATKTADDKHNAIYISRLVSGVWSEPEVLIADQNEITSLDYGKFGSEYVIAYTVDTDGDINTSDDMALIIIDQNGNAKQIDSGFIADVQFANVNGVSSLFWYKDGNIYYMNGNTQTVYTVLDGNYSDCGNYRVITLADGRTMLTFVSGTSITDEDGNIIDNGSDIFGVFVTENGVSGLPVRLTNSGGYIDNYDIEVVDGQLLISFVLTDAQIEGETITTSTDFKFTLMDLSDNLTLDRVDFDDSEIKSGESFTIDTTVTNNGISDISSVTAIITDNTGKVVFEEIININLKPGESATVTLNVTAPAEILSDLYTLSIVANGITDIDETDNEQKIRLGVSDLSIVAQQTVIGSGNYITVNVTNNGNIATDGTIIVYNKNGEKIAELEIGTIGVGETKQFLVDVSLIAADGNIVCTVTSNEFESYEPDNSTQVYVVVVNPNTIVSVLNSTVTEAPQLDKTTATYDKYTDTKIDVTITTGIDNFAGITGLTEGTDYTVSDNVVSINSQYLNSLTNGLNILKFTFDYGTAGAVTRSVSVTVKDTTPIALTGNVAISGDVLAGNTVNADLSGITIDGATFEYKWSIDGTPVGTDSSYEINATDIGKILTLEIIGTGVYTGTVETSQTVGNPVKDIPVSPVAEKIGADYIKFIYAPNVEYSIDGTHWQSNNLFEGLTPGTSYNAYARYVQSGIVGNPSVAATVTTKLLISGSISIDGVAENGYTLSVDLSQMTVGNEDNLTYQWYRDGMEIAGATESTYTATEADMGKEIKVVITGINGYMGTLEASVTIRDYILGNVNADASINIFDVMMVLQAANQQITLTPTQKLAADVDKNGTVTIFDAMELLQYVNAKISTLE